MQEIESYTEIVNRWIEAFNAHNVSALVSLYTDDAELFDTGMKRVRHGRGEIEAWFTTRFRTMPTIAYAPASRLFAEKQAAVTWTATGRTPRLLGLPFFSRPFQVDGVSVFTFRDGLIQQQHGYYDHLSVIEHVLPPLKLLPTRL